MEEDSGKEPAPEKEGVERNTPQKTTQKEMPSRGKAPWRAKHILNPEGHWAGVRGRLTWEKRRFWLEKTKLRRARYLEHH